MTTKEIAERSLFEIPAGTRKFLWTLVVLGVGMFIIGLLMDGESRLRV